MTIKTYTKPLYSRGTIKYLNDLFWDKKVLKDVNWIIGSAINNYVPKKSGKLRRSMIVTHKSISWGRGLPYAHYQHEGIVYAPNYPIMQGGNIVGWFSPRGQKKHPTNRELGAHGIWGVNGVTDSVVDWKGWHFGYTTIGTMHHWENIYEWRLKEEVNREITKYLKTECKKRKQV